MTDNCINKQIILYSITSQIQNSLASEADPRWVFSGPLSKKNEANEWVPLTSNPSPIWNPDLFCTFINWHQAKDCVILLFPVKHKKILEALAWEWGFTLHDSDLNNTLGNWLNIYLPKRPDISGQEEVVKHVVLFSVNTSFFLCTPPICSKKKY